MGIGAVLIKLKANLLDNAKLWKGEVEERKSETIETLKVEGISFGAINRSGQ
ncbi:hypothetical protein [Acinetobacter stercoris]|uniref:Uncharacterized protein n=1 Tax=Acinetobacter stercoris TaxID=2126983 RepID=A0A2U3N343_9GAMM|nr:hypothetical protein [Acinetobacter stercoris]SPL72053.1 hypothetical protein KPC_3231 [Acinetobacter stercoris]